MAKKYLSTLKVSAGLFSAILIVLLVNGLPANAQTVSTETKDQGLQMSLLISSPSTEAVYTRYGHVAFRILNPVQGTDIAYNYGMFDYNEPNFILRFVRGETDYYVEALYTSYYVEEYLRSGRGIVELVLNLTQEEIEKAERYLAWNIRPENKRYRYNIFYDNCATRLIEIIKETTGATLQIPHEGEERKWRQLIDECCTDAPWVKFGIDLALGAKTDTYANPEEQLFLPNRMLDLLPRTTLLYPNGRSTPLIRDTKEWFPAKPASMEPAEEGWPTPLLASIALLIVSIAVAVWDVRRKDICYVYDSILLAIMGLSGCVIFILSFFSEHPHTNPNYNLFLLHPLHLLIGLPLTVVPLFHRAGFVYHFINFAELSLIGLAIWFLPQQVVLPLYVAGIALWLLSARWILVNRWRKNVR